MFCVSVARLRRWVAVVLNHLGSIDGEYTKKGKFDKLLVVRDSLINFSKMEPLSDN